jgi:hypothetical protein
MTASAQVSSQPRAALLRGIFDGNAEQYFVVLRNDERLPGELTGTDLDVCVSPQRTPEEVMSYLVTVGSRLGWSAAAVSRRPHMIGFTLVRAGEDEVDAIHFDVFNGITYLGLPLCDPATLHAESRVRDGVRLLSPRGKSIATVVHHLAWNGYLSKEKYRSEFAQLLRDPVDGPWMRARLGEVFGIGIARALCSPEGLTRLERSTVNARLQLSAALFRQAARKGLTYPARRLGSYWLGQCSSFRIPPGVVGREGDGLKNLDGMRLTPEIACGVTPHGCWAPSARCHASAVRTLNGPRYQRTTTRAWARWTFLRWTLPSLFLLYQAKRGRIVVLTNRLPLGLRLLRRAGHPAWIGIPPGAPTVR